jgi:hypothetical protein
MHSDNTIAYSIIVAALYSAEEFDGDPLLFTLHKGSHDLRDTFLIETLRLKVVNVFLVVFSCLLLPRPLCHGCVPTITIVNA